MNSNQQPCMSCWQNAWPPALCTNQTAASHSHLIMTPRARHFPHSWWRKHSSPPFYLFVSGWPDWRGDDSFKWSSFLCLRGGSHGFPPGTGCRGATTNDSWQFAQKSKSFFQIPANDEFKWSRKQHCSKINRLTGLQLVLIGTGWTSGEFEPEENLTVLITGLNRLSWSQVLLAVSQGLKHHCVAFGNAGALLSWGVRFMWQITHLKNTAERFLELKLRSFNHFYI